MLANFKFTHQRLHWVDEMVTSVPLTSVVTRLKIRHESHASPWQSRCNYIMVIKTS